MMDQMDLADKKLQKLINVARKSKNERLAYGCACLTVTDMDQEDIGDLHDWIKDFSEPEAKAISTFIEENL